MFHVVSREFMTLNTGAKSHIPSHIYQTVHYLAPRITPEIDLEFMRFSWERTKKRGAFYSIGEQGVFSLEEGVDGLR